MRAACLTLLLLVGLPAHAGNEECWSRGYRDGWCDARDKPSCPQLIAPRAPAPAADQDDCDARYVEGYVAGQKAGMPPALKGN